MEKQNGGTIEIIVVQRLHLLWLTHTFLANSVLCTLPLPIPDVTAIFSLHLHVFTPTPHLTFKRNISVDQLIWFDRKEKFIPLA